MSQEPKWSHKDVNYYFYDVDILEINKHYEYVKSDVKTEFEPGSV